jgi:hypothetical protein
MKCFSLWLALTALAGNAGAATCPIVPIQNHGAFISFGAFKGHLISDSDPGNSTAWEGPLIITNPSGKSCSAEISIISPPFFFAGSHDLYVTTYSGSENVQYLVDANTCNILWSSPQFTGDPKLTNGDSFTYLDARPVKIDPTCLPRQN